MTPNLIKVTPEGLANEEFPATIALNCSKRDKYKETLKKFLQRASYKHNITNRIQLLEKKS